MADKENVVVDLLPKIAEKGSYARIAQSPQVVIQLASELDEVLVKYIDKLPASELLVALQLSRRGLLTACERAYGQSVVDVIVTDVAKIEKQYEQEPADDDPTAG